MFQEREPQIIAVTGTRGVGKTYTTTDIIKDYVKPNPQTGKVPRKVLIYDVNKEYTEFKSIDLENVRKFSRQDKAEVRRVLPITEDGKEASIDEMVRIMHDIVSNFRGGLLVLEDLNKYMVAAKDKEVIGLIVTNRHRDLDIILHYQSLSALDPRIWQNANQVRFHYQMDNIQRYRNRIPNFELFKLAQCLVEYKYFDCNDARFYCYVSNELNYITGDFDLNDFKQACFEYFRQFPKVVTQAAKRFGKGKEAQNKAIIDLTGMLVRKYYQGK